MATAAAPDRMQELAVRVRGQVFPRGHEGYDDARAVWNGMIDHRPAAVVRCTGTADVMAAVNFARERDLPVSVRGGGHGVSGGCIRDGALVLDLSRLRGVRVDPGTRTARVGPGARWGDFDHEAQAFGLATTGGVDSRTGVAGLTLGGGIGWLARSIGLAADNLLSVDLVTAAGERVRASEDANADLFWGIRGAGGSFGAVTSFEFRLHPVGPDVLTAQVFHPMEDAADALRFYREYMADAPDEVGCYALIVHVPPTDPFPPEHHGEDTLALVGCYSGPAEEGEEALAPLGEFGDPIVAAIQPMPYAALQQSFDAGYPDGERYYWKSRYLEGLPDGAIDTMIEYTTPLPGPFTAAFLESMGGAINRVPADDTAYPHRDAAFNLGIATGWSSPAEDGEMIAWTRDFHAAMEPYGSGVYVNYLDRDEDDRIREAYGPNYERLVRLKNEWDPDHLFRTNSDIEPTV